MSAIDLLHTADTQSWMRDSLCAQAGPGFADEFLFPSRTDGNCSPKAVAMCRACPVRRECLQWAIDTNQQFGVWGGLTPNQRRKRRAA